METRNPRAEWESLGDKWFRKTQLYTAVFDQDLDLDNYIVAGAPYGGALGVSISIESEIQALTAVLLRSLDDSFPTIFAHLIASLDYATFEAP